jgi:iron complex outermembrane receptor protein
VSAAAGSLLQDFGAVRYGGNVGSNFFYRVYGQRLDQNNSLLANGDDAPDDWNLTQGGFRTDWYPPGDNTLTIQGDFYGANEDGIPTHASLDGQNLLARWTHNFSAESELQVQTYFDRTWRNIPNSFAEALTTYDIDAQHRFPLGERQSIVWGGGYRLMKDRIQNTAALAFLPPNKDLQLFSAFVQDEIVLVPDRLRFAVGTKLEHNDYSGFEVQPSTRLAWTPDEKQTIWGAVSRGVRSPSRIDTDLFTPAPPVAPGTPNLAGGPNFDAEELLALELGYRIHPIDRLSIALATYYNFYDDLRSLDQPTPNNYVLGNHYQGEIWGIELSAQYQATGWWRLRGGYNYLHKDLWPNGGVGVSPSVREGNDPEHQFSFQSIVDLPAHFQFDMTGRYVDTLPAPLVPSYFSLTVRLAWQYKQTEISLVGQNLTDPKHPEFGTRQIPRSIHGMITWRF